MSPELESLPSLRVAEPPLKLRQSVDASELALVHLPVIPNVFSAGGRQALDQALRKSQLEGRRAATEDGVNTIKSSLVREGLSSFDNPLSVMLLPQEARTPGLQTLDEAAAALSELPDGTALDDEDARRLGLVILGGLHRWKALARLVSEAGEEAQVADQEDAVVERVTRVYARVYSADILRRPKILNRLIHAPNARHHLASLPHKLGLRAYIAHHLRGRSQPEFRVPLASPPGEKAFYASVLDRVRTTVFSKALQTSDLLSTSLAFQSNAAISSLLGKGLKDGIVFVGLALEGTASFLRAIDPSGELLDLSTFFLITQVVDMSNPLYVAASIDKVEESATIQQRCAALADRLQTAIDDARCQDGSLATRTLFGKAVPPNLRATGKSKDGEYLRRKKEAEQAAIEALPRFVASLRKLDAGTVSALADALLAIVQVQQGAPKLLPRLAGWSDFVLVLLAFLRPEEYAAHLRRQRNSNEPVDPYIESTATAQAFTTFFRVILHNAHDIITDLAIASSRALADGHASRDAILTAAFPPEHVELSASARDALSAAYLLLPATFTGPSDLEPLPLSPSLPSYFPWFSTTLSQEPPSVDLDKIFRPSTACAVVRRLLSPAQTTVAQSTLPASLRGGINHALLPQLDPLGSQSEGDLNGDNDGIRRRDHEDDAEHAYQEDEPQGVGRIAKLKKKKAALASQAKRAGSGSTETARTRSKKRASEGTRARGARAASIDQEPSKKRKMVSKEEPALASTRRILAASSSAMSLLVEEHDASRLEPSSPTLLHSLDEVQRGANPFCLYLLKLFAQSSPDNLALFRAVAATPPVDDSEEDVDAPPSSAPDAILFCPAFRAFLDRLDHPVLEAQKRAAPLFTAYHAVASAVALVQSELWRLRTRPAADPSRLFWAGGGEEVDGADSRRLVKSTA
ncbi:hypothetical protein JCM11641_003269 [Rhodosporidiobolus odoratus]